MTDARVELLLDLIRTECQAILRFTTGLSQEEFLTSDLVQHAVSMSLIAIGEYATRLAKTSPEFVATRTDIPWLSIVGMRNRIAHGYYGLDFVLVWETVNDSIPELLSVLR